MVLLSDGNPKKIGKMYSGVPEPRIYNLSHKNWHVFALFCCGFDTRSYNVIHLAAFRGLHHRLSTVKAS